MKRTGVLLLMLLSGLYLLNPTWGVFELLPDNIPFIGNVDEALAAYVLYSGLEFLRGRKIGIFRARH
ncbi:MAG: DUF1232 domain-containing protein [Cyclobacteriaceae bacterium]|jgi:hypothetical protein|nr:DUF1232 domain-containing protein [Cyclobacteriaceae bacterium]